MGEFWLKMSLIKKKIFWNNNGLIRIDYYKVIDIIVNNNSNSYSFSNNNSNSNTSNFNNNTNNINKEY